MPEFDRDPARAGFPKFLIYAAFDDIAYLTNTGSFRTDPCHHEVREFLSIQDMNQVVEDYWRKGKIVGVVWADDEREAYRESFRCRK